VPGRRARRAALWAGLRDGVHQSGKILYRNDIASPKKGTPSRKRTVDVKSAFSRADRRSEDRGVSRLFDKPGGFGEEDTRIASAFAEIGVRRVSK